MRLCAIVSMVERLELALGTAQFGMAYGIAGSTAKVADREIVRILDVARSAGLSRIDTAPAYGDIEERIADLARARDVTFVSKISAAPKDVEPGIARAHVVRSIEISRGRLGERLKGLIFHDAADARNRIVRDAADSAIHGLDIALGLSAYDIGDVLDVAEAWPALDMAQIPANAFDQRISTVALPAVELTLRSAFLQGLLLMPADRARERLPRAARAIDQWHLWCSERNLTPLVGAFAIIKALLPHGFCLVGVDNSKQLEEIFLAWDRAKPVSAPELAQSDLDIIDPRFWRPTP